MKQQRITQAISRLVFGSLIFLQVSVQAVPLPGGSLDPTTIPKYVLPLVIPPEMPPSTSNSAVNYQIAVRQFEQQILPPGFEKTTVWSYGSVDHPGTVAQGGSFNYPAFTVEATSNNTTTVKWINDLVDEKGKFLPHLLKDTVDQTLHWANPPAEDCMDGTDRTDCVGTTKKPYKGPVPIVTHLHGAHVGPKSDGYPEAWWLPAAKNIPKKYATSGSLFNDATGTNPGNLGYAIYSYPNTQDETTLWYHDHSLGMTRQNVYAGPAGFWLLRDKNGQEKNLNLPGPAPKIGDSQGNNPFGKYYEIPLVIQDRSFNEDGSLFYPKHRAFFEGVPKKKLKIKFAPKSDVAKLWNPEAFFNVMVVNGVSWPYLNVDQGRYRFRILNGSNSRFLNLALFVVYPDGSVGEELPMWVIGSDQGLVSDVVEVKTGKSIVYDDETGTTATIITNPSQALLIAPAERSDIIVDFSGLKPDTFILMVNTAPDAPFGGFPDIPADPETTGQVMRFIVGSDKAPNFADPTKLALADNAPLVASNTRILSLNEEESTEVCVVIKPDGTIKQLKKVKPGPMFIDDCMNAGGAPFAPRAALLGTVDSIGTSIPLLWSDPITENPAVGNTEEWAITNFTVDAHPIHLHLVKFQVIGRELIGGGPAPIDLQPFENGFKDTVIAYPGEITRVRAHFDLPGLYVWHCHILEHEDNEMMRPYCAGIPGQDCPTQLF
jgi:FtsP/CotA-like multicopper oxidase with cupredoxin domain